MSVVEDFFRHCPACGRRFHIKLISRKLVGERKEGSEIKQAMIGPLPVGYAGGSNRMTSVIVEENIPITIDIRDFQYSYKCKHCGHSWTELREKESKE